MEKLIRIAEEEIRRDPAMWFWSMTAGRMERDVTVTASISARP